MVTPIEFRDSWIKHVNEGNDAPNKLARMDQFIPEIEKNFSSSANAQDRKFYEKLLRCVQGLRAADRTDVEVCSSDMSTHPIRVSLRGNINRTVESNVGNGGGIEIAVYRAFGSLSKSDDSLPSGEGGSVQIGPVVALDIFDEAGEVNEDDEDDEAEGGENFPRFQLGVRLRLDWWENLGDSFLKNVRPFIPYFDGGVGVQFDRPNHDSVYWLPFIGGGLEVVALGPFAIAMGVRIDDPVLYQLGFGFQWEID